MLSHAPATSYELKQRVGMTVGNFWAFAHSQLYDEPARLADDGLVSSSVEEGGRRKRTYSITDAGRAALSDWLAGESREQTEVRDIGLLKLFFSAMAGPEDLRTLAEHRHESHRTRADNYLAQREQIINHADPWQVKTLELGIRFERTVEEFWAELLAELDADRGAG
jgi:PadR family transcriptional regulator, regulatory protein AphA